MEKYLTGMKRKAERDGDNETNVSLPKAKTRKYDEAYVALGFTVTTVGDEERPNPKILLLDEATSAHDAENDFLVQEALERLMDGRKVLIIAHRLTTIQNADAVAVLGQRCVVDCGQHAQLLGNRQGLFRKLMEKQTFFQEGQKQALKRAEDRGALKM